MYRYKPEGSKVPIEVRSSKEEYLKDLETVQQAENVSRLPFVFHHVFLAPDFHRGFGLPIGGVAAFNNVLSPYCVGSDIACGMLFFRTSIKVAEINKDFIIKLRSEVKKLVPVGHNRHKEPQDEKHMPDISKYEQEFINDKIPIFIQEQDVTRVSIGTLGGGNHFLEFQEDDQGFLCIMIHSGSRNLGMKICNFYDKLAQDINTKWYSSIPPEWKLSFLPFQSVEGQSYYLEMLYAMEFAKCNRKLMSLRVKEVLGSMINNVTFEKSIDVHHNFARMENHFGRNVVIHRKGATSAKKGEVGIIPGDQGSPSYIVEGLGNPVSFSSCSHGAGRVLGRKAAQNTLNLEEEIKKLDDQGIIHNITSTKHLEEASGAYKDIDDVMKRQSDLVKIVTKLKPLGVIKG